MHTQKMDAMRRNPTDKIGALLKKLYFERAALNKVIQHIESFRSIRASRVRQFGPLTSPKEIAKSVSQSMGPDPRLSTQRRSSYGIDCHGALLE